MVYFTISGGIKKDCFAFSTKDTKTAGQDCTSFAMSFLETFPVLQKVRQK